MVKRLLVALLLPTVLLCACAGGGKAALEPGEEQEVGTDPAEIGSHEHFALTPFNPQGEEPVHFRSAQLVGVPEGMEVVDIRAVERTEDKTAYGWRGDLETGMGAGLKFHRVQDVVLRPGAAFEEYYLVATVAARKPGEFHTKGLKVAWTAGKRKGETFFPYLVGLVTPGADQS